MHRLFMSKGVLGGARIALLWGIVACVAACSGETTTNPGTSCVPACGAGFVCVDGACVSECNPPCNENQVCVLAQCIDESEAKTYDYPEMNAPPEFNAGGQTWDNTNLRYYITDFTPDVTEGEAVNAIHGAFDRWHTACPTLNFERVFDPGNADIVIRWASGEHGDLSPFDGKGKVLAHAYFPGGGLGGDTHFDDAEQWSSVAGADAISLPAVALHEFGHALGLDHTADQSSIMYPYYRPDVTELSQDDLIGIASLYNCAAMGSCGDMVVSADEECDTTDLNGAICQDLGFSGGSLSCSPNCTFDTTNCITMGCGNNIKEAGEQCDGDKLGGAICQSLGFGGGSLSCNPDCTFNTTNCTIMGCGNNIKEAGEQCDGAQLGGATCQSLGYSQGFLWCNPDCTINTGGCCNDSCVPGSSVCMNNQVMACGNYDADACMELGNALACINGQQCVGNSCACSPGNTGQYVVTDYVYPNFGPLGCAGDNGMKLKAAAAMISPTMLRVYIKKGDNSAFTSPGTLSLYVGNGPTCPNPVNVVKQTASIVVGAAEQIVEMTMYNGAWALNEVKIFWVGKDEGAFQSYRATGTFSVQRVCIP